MTKGIIYKWTNKITGESYIGQTKHEEDRKLAHEQCTGNSKFHKALRYYGLINFEYEKLEEVDEDKLNEREIYWIRYYDSKNHGYNTLKGGQPKLKEITKTKKELGLHYTGRVMFGYKTDDKGAYIIDENAANIVKSIFEDYVNGMSYRGIGDKYNKHYGVILEILNRECYYGCKSNMPAIITKELYDKAQLMKIHNKLIYHDYDHKLKGKLYDEHGNIFSTNNGAKYFIVKKTGKTISFNVINKLLDNINIEFDKIIVTWISYKNRRFDIISHNKIIQTYKIIINNVEHQIIKL